MTELRPIVTLADVLTADELPAQPYPAATALNDPHWMPDALSDSFVGMANSERRDFTQTAIRLATSSHTPLAHTLAVLLEAAYTVPPSVRNGTP